MITTLKPDWRYEARDWRDDPESGARIIQLTCGPNLTNNIYCEQPYGSPDGKRIALLRYHDYTFAETCMLLVFDLSLLRVMLVEREIIPGIANNAWSGRMHYWRKNGDLVRFDLTTLQQRVLLNRKDAADLASISSISPDQRYALARRIKMQGTGDSGDSGDSGGPTIQIVRLDLEKQSEDVIFEHPEITNPHLQFNPVHGRQILVQNNRGLRINPDGSYFHAPTAQGTTLFVIDADGKNQRFLPAGPPDTHTCTGHECFIADTGKIAFTTSWRHDTWKLAEPYTTGNLFTAAPGDAKPTVFPTPAHKFNHVCVSRCGKYFVCDSYTGSALFVGGEHHELALVIGNLHTGLYRTLVKECRASSGGAQCTHAHPYLTADNSHVIFNADPNHSIPQVFAAKIPPAFLASLG